jgi:CheY-like chemotaxis protein
MDDTAKAQRLAEDQPVSRPLDAIANEILIAEDHPVSLHLLERYLSDWGFQIKTAADGEEALKILESDTAPPLAIIDWGMPKIDGIKVCAHIRERRDRPYTYLMLLTARNKVSELMTGLDSGADDYVTKPYDPDELRARIRTGQRVVALERTLQAQVAHLEDALAHVKKLKDLLPICMYCKRIRDDKLYWHQVEQYLHDAVGTDFSHGVCPNCVGVFHAALWIDQSADT